MTINNIDTNEALENVKKLLEKEKNISPALKAAIEVIMLLVTLLVNRLGLNSRNSSKPPSSDFGQNKKSPSDKEHHGKGRKPGGQPGRQGKTLKPVDQPDEIIPIEMDRHTLAAGLEYTADGFEKRQVFSLKISRHVVEYQAENSRR